ncbi:MAG: VOC family protein [Acidobacteria bacterium]|nr:VOC family protein [Acidobacteriota bacterium]
MSKAARPIPEGHHTVTPHLVLRNAAKAIEFYKKALGAQELGRMTSPDGKIGHAELKIGDSIIFLADEFDMGPGSAKAPESVGACTATLNLYVPDVDATYQQAVAAGGKATMPVTDMFWGDRYGTFTDPFGHMWGVATHKEDLTKEEVEERAKAFWASMQHAQRKSA